jgi:hypothetical protein
VKWRIGGSLTCPLAVEWRGEVQDHLRLHQFLRAVVFVLVVAVMILIHFVVVMFSSHINVQQVFLVLFTVVSNTIACICRRGVDAGVFQLVHGWCSFPA